MGAARQLQTEYSRSKEGRGFNYSFLSSKEGFSLFTYTVGFTLPDQEQQVNYFIYVEDQEKETPLQASQSQQEKTESFLHYVIKNPNTVLDSQLPHRVTRSMARDQNKGVLLQYKHGIILSQRKYFLDLLEETGMMGCRPTENPLDANKKLCASTEEEVDVKKYQRLVGKLIYLYIMRLDISYAVRAPGRGILYKNHGLFNIEGFSNADWARSPDDRKSTSGYCAMVGGNLVTWRSKKQNIVARSSAKVEYRAISHTVSELLCIRSLLTELGFDNKAPMDLYCDN
ncbi:uncharacterized mitochondrial protein AtMg00810-like [Aristolochia californica]|uniref:uncharacterized mitochondrial protein AtMg00810-like n=1 Tax=Aristolochia californica TaxID=171875 RepID=UPI0035DC74A2